MCVCVDVCVYVRFACRVLTVERDTLLQRVETFANGTSTNRPPDTPHNTNPNNISSHTSTSSRGHSSPGGGAAAAAAAASSSSGGAAAAAAAADAADVPTISDADLQELDTLLEGFSETAAAVAAEQQRLKAQRAGGAGGGGGGGLLNGFFRPQQSEVKVNTGRSCEFVFIMWLCMCAHKVYTTGTGI